MLGPTLDLLSRGDWIGRPNDREGYHSTCLGRDSREACKASRTLAGFLKTTSSRANMGTQFISSDSAFSLPRGVN